MKINRRQFCLKFGAILIVLVLHNRNAFSTDLMEEQPCKATDNNTCVVVCRDWDLGLQNGVAGLKEILEAEGKKHKTCALIFKRCTLKTETTNLWEDLNPIDEPKIDDLKISHSSIDINKLNLKIFRNVFQLTVENTTTAVLEPEVFQKLPHLRRLQLKKNKFLKSVQNGFLQNLTLDYLQIQGVDLNQTETLKFFQNLSAEREISSIRELDWSHNNFGNFPKNLLAPFPNLKVLNLTNSRVSGFEDEIFSNGNFKRVYINENEIQKLPEKIFRPLLERGAMVSLEGNQLICDCEMEWLKSWVKDKKFRIECAAPEGEFLEVEMCPEKNSSAVRCTPRENFDYHLEKSFNESSKIFTITNNEPEHLEIILSETTDLERAFLWYGNYENMTSPHFKCLKILHRKFIINTKPDVNYLICLATVYKYFQIDISDCLPLKTKPHHEDQPWLTKKSIPLSIISIFVVFLFALATGALILYLSVRKNPSLIRGSKRVIEVKRHDKAQILIMPRGYEPVSQVEGSPLALAAPRFPLVPSRSCDTISTVSYVSANQPTQLEILTYRFNRLRELFQRNTVSSFLLPSQMITPISQRLPPNVDLLLEYEWYTITTTTTTQV